jgi:hypothetical protein
MSEKKDVRISESRFKVAEFVSNNFAVTVEPEINLDDLLKPEYWAEVAMYLNPGDIVDVRWDDGKFYCRLYVNQCSRTYANMYVLGHHDLRLGKENETDILDGYIYKWRGPHHRHCIVRVKDGAVMTSEQPSKEDALKWLIQNKTRLAA